MVGLLDDVKQRTQLVGHNRLELLLFQLDTKQRFGINVFKVREVIMCPRPVLGAKYTCSGARNCQHPGSCHIDDRPWYGARTRADAGHPNAAW